MVEEQDEECFHPEKNEGDSYERSLRTFSLSLHKALEELFFARAPDQKQKQFFYHLERVREQQQFCSKFNHNHDT